MGRCHRQWELRLNQSVKPHHLPQQMIQKPLRRGKVSFLCTSAKTKRTHTLTHTRAAASQVRGVCFTESPDVDRSSESHFTPLFFLSGSSQNRSSACFALAQASKTVSIWRFYLFILLPISVTLGVVSISGSLWSPSGIDVKSLLASVKLNDSAANCTSLRFPPRFKFTLPYLKPSSWFFMFTFFFISCGFCFSSRLSASVFASHLQIWHRVDCFLPHLLL